MFEDDQKVEQFAADHFSHASGHVYRVKLDLSHTILSTLLRELIPAPLSRMCNVEGKWGVEYYQPLIN